jgi:predicted MFS family arabinose efflux permease
MTATIPASRRGEGLGYWGLASVLAIGAAPALGFWVYHQGWMVLCLELASLNLLMAVIAWFLPDDRDAARAERRVSGEAEAWSGGVMTLVRSHVEWRVVLLSLATSLVSFGYGALTSFSALFVDELGISPRSLFLSVMAGATVIGRLTIGRTLDAVGPRRVLVRCMAAPPLGLLLLSIAKGTPMVVLAALVFGAGFGLLLPSYNTYVLTHVHANKRGAAFGAMLAAFDTGIGAGSSAMGWLVHAQGFRFAFTVAAVLAALALPYFLFAERKLGFADLRTGAAGVRP